MGSREEHEKLLEEVIKDFRKRGLKVIKLIKNADGLLIIDNNIIAIEVTSSNMPFKIYHKKSSYENSGFDGAIIIGKNLSKGYVPIEVYNFVLQLRSQNIKFKDIQEELKKKYPNYVVCLPTLSNWCKGRKPRLI